jgi:hypothetical protein
VVPPIEFGATSRKATLDDIITTTLLMDPPLRTGFENHRLADGDVTCPHVWNETVEQLAANPFTTPQDAIASLLQRLVRHSELAG